ncbi:TIGR03619 family F420-dependent LLM class oxidoreductase [Blastococcus sp. URHD0036]|uniref:TIGR03619 family F420-dependent LLM class oxidoreductase n=1 Tax=Blastococcus sp. URHD0036 TaxID=1380356 RepID=UPI000494DB30|nr:TIGR03619 family F420-dependent LLM class oxidoreductase [Blastococcus sp. URHD0036]
MKLAFGLPNLIQLKALTRPWEYGVTGADQTRLARWADSLGYEMISVPEHHVIPADHVELSGEHYFSAYSSMGYLAGATERIRVNSSIALLPLQHPIVTAKALSSIDFLSGGRVTVTFGVGWLKEEFDLLGVPFGERGARAEEYVQAIIALWTEEKPAFEGRYVSFRDVAFAPRPVQQPHLPIWFGGDADAVLRRTARHASGWWPFLTPPEQIPEKLDYIRSQPDYNGRLDEVFYSVSTRSVGDGHTVEDNPYVHDGMSKEELIDQLGWLAGLGVTISGVPMPAEVASVQEYLDHTQWVAEEIMPAIA